MKPILEIQHISKKFRINHEQQPYLSLRDSLANIFKLKTTTEDFWALNDVSFDVMPGDTFGIIGKNGAGKSTLLKILSKITPPTSGKIIGRGRIASLLEVGTGFHAELSGRENVFMNGSILGMKRAEILKNFNAIVDFAGVEKFIDTPLKHYSSGMQLRLAFAVAAFLENEILIIDEVLAVGDAEFQKKCMRKMEDISKNQERSILFVSHNLGAIQSLCNKGILLQNGKQIHTGNIENVIEKYIHQEKPSSNLYDLINLPRSGYNGDLLFEKFSMINDKLKFGETIKFKLSILSKTNDNFKNLDFGIAVTDLKEAQLIHISNRFINLKFDYNEKENIYEFEIENCLNSGIYNITFFLRANNIIQDWLQSVVSFEILDGNPYNFPNSKEIKGLIIPKFNIKQIHER